MNKKSMEDRFYHFVIPSMLAMLLNGLYTIVDGFFIGRAVGDAGLAAIGLVWPITAVLIALGMGIGAGGSVLMSAYRGAGRHRQANEARANAIMLLVGAGVVMTLFLSLFHTGLVRSLGAAGSVFDSAISYVRIISLGGSMQIVASGLIPIIRNSQKTVQAMFIMCAGLVTNIILDAAFTIVLPWGLTGAALATIIAQAVTVVCCAICLAREREHRIERNQFRVNWVFMAKTAAIGVSPFGLSLMPSLITVFNNWQCLAYGGDMAVAAYSVINYMIASELLLLEGIGEGMQPLISYLSGAGEYDAMRRIRDRGIKMALILSVLFILLSFGARHLLPQVFGTSEDTARIISLAVPILCAAFPMMGLGKLFTSYFYACKDSLSSTFLVYSDPLLFTPLCIVILPRLFGLNGVWMALPAAQFLVMILLMILFVIHSKKSRYRGTGTVETKCEI